MATKPAKKTPKSDAEAATLAVGVDQLHPFVRAQLNLASAVAALARWPHHPAPTHLVDGVESARLAVLAQAQGLAGTLPALASPDADAKGALAALETRLAALEEKAQPPIDLDPIIDEKLAARLAPLSGLSEDGEVAGKLSNLHDRLQAVEAVKQPADPAGGDQ